LKEPFELEWLGGVAAKYFRRIRPGVDDFPWGTLPVGEYPPLLVERARLSWTEAAFNEYTTAYAFGELLLALLEAKAPVDLIGMAGDFVADEMLHVELTSRLAMELGGGAPHPVDFSGLSQRAAPGPALARAAELSVRICCVAEAFSLPMLAGCLKSAAHPLTRAVLERIVQDEAPHGRLGWLFLDWAAERLDDSERARLAAIALDMLRVLSPLWTRLTSRVSDGVTSEGFLVRHVNELGWMEASAYGARARASVQDDVVAPLARHGITLDERALSELLDPASRAPASNAQ
jgi:hypothetical protein